MSDTIGILICLGIVAAFTALSIWVAVKHPEWIDENSWDD